MGCPKGDNKWRINGFKGIVMETGSKERKVS